MTAVALTKYEGGQIEAFHPQTVLEQVSLIQEVMRSAMKEGEHFGTIPGCGDKKTLLKSGAEKLAFTFRLAPQFAVTITDLGSHHREYSVTCTLLSINSGKQMGQGVGSCSTMEGKWRYRSESTGKPVPPAYWQSRDISLLGGQGYSPRKTGKDWIIFHRVEHDNPYDYYNTCLKMAKKRALVDAVLTVTAASDCFTQDVEDIEENLQHYGGDAPSPETPTPRTSQPKNDPPPSAVVDLKPVAPSADGALQSYEVMRVAQKSGTSPKGKPWTRYGVLLKDSIGNEAWANSFDDGAGTLKPGDKIRAELQNTERGMNLVRWEPDVAPGTLSAMVQAEIEQ